MVSQRSGQRDGCSGQEFLIVKVLLNHMAFEGAREHFRQPFPDVPESILDELAAIGAPEVFRGSEYTSSPDFLISNVTVFEKCFCGLSIIRNNLIHANKARQPDRPERLSELLAWAERFIDAVYIGESPFASCAQDIKDTLGIKNF